ncbi:right-handed parallel beta-helix repeat-containing protein [Thermococcus barossii]|uniref:Pectinesterase catalytic domain-containing protein n=1 Tax=Thermococcus barossii TaxID=54077 RepID=A0A2Z2MNI4_9EURY|nr:hypothetical protein [Thermococcus barossii]ASJ03951.1 hypothetical protein A3L01_00680 [Thermococcus barossii]
MRGLGYFPILLTFLLLSSMLSAPSYARAGAIPVVRNLNTGEIFSSINEAISDPDTKPGHVILLDSGRYIESVTVDKAVVIRSVSGNPEDVIVEAPEPGLPVFRIKASGAVVKALTITGTKKIRNVFHRNRQQHRGVQYSRNPDNFELRWDLPGTKRRGPCHLPEPL